MKLRSTRIYNYDASLRSQSDLYRPIPVSRKRNSRPELIPSSISTPHIQEYQNTPERRPKYVSSSQLLETTLDTRIQSRSPTKLSARVPSKVQYKGHIFAPQAHNETQKRKTDTPVENKAERPLKRARLTEKNLRALEKMRGRRNDLTRKKITGQSPSITTTTDKDFGTKLQQNNIVYNSFEARAADDAVEIRELLNRRRASEPPDRLIYNRYLVLTEDYENELAVGTCAYPLLSKRTGEREVSGYFQRPNHSWSVVANHLTSGLGNAQADIVESYRKTDYPLTVTESLSGELAPSLYNEAMPAYAVEFKGSSGNMKEAKLQCAYNGALMAEGAHSMQKYLNRPGDDFYGKTQALTITYNEEAIKFYGHHVEQVPPPLQQFGEVESSQETGSGTVDGCQYSQYLIASDNPSDSFEDFQRAYKHIRNAQDIGYRSATEWKNTLWAYIYGNNAQNMSTAPISSQQLPSDALAFHPFGTPGGNHSCGALGDKTDLTDQLFEKPPCANLIGK